MSARLRCWIHDDCVSHPEIGAACGPNPPDMLVLHGDWGNGRDGWGDGCNDGEGGGGGASYGDGFGGLNYGDGGGDGAFGDGSRGGGVGGGRWVDGWHR